MSAPCPHGIRPPWACAECDEAAYQLLTRAAPDLYAALDDAPQPYDYMSRSDFNSLSGKMRSFVDAHKTWMQKARAALAKARGEA